MSKFRSQVLIRIGVALFTLTLAACGGGGGGGGGAPPGPVVSTLSFPLQAGIATLNENGSSANLTAEGTPAPSTKGLCSGTFSTTSGPASTPATFESVPGWSATTVETLTLTNCPGSGITTSTDFYNLAFQDLGYSVAGGEYAVWRAPPVFPVSVKVGDMGNVGTIDYYTDSTKATPDGFSDVRFIVLPRTADTVIVEAQSTIFDATGQEEGWQGDQWVITSSGAMTRVLVQFFTPPGPGSGGELVLFFHD